MTKTTRRFGWMLVGCLAISCAGEPHREQAPATSAALSEVDKQLHRATIHLMKQGEVCVFDRATPPRLGQGDQVDIEDVIQWTVVPANCDDPIVQIGDFDVIECGSSSPTGESGDPLDPYCSRTGMKITCTVDEDEKCFKYSVIVDGVNYDPELETRGAMVGPPPTPEPGDSEAPEDPEEPEGD